MRKREHSAHKLNFVSIHTLNFTEYLSKVSIRHTKLNYKLNLCVSVCVTFIGELFVKSPILAQSDTNVNHIALNRMQHTLELVHRPLVLLCMHLM